MYTYDAETETIDFNCYGYATPFTVLKTTEFTTTVKGKLVFKYKAVPGLWTVWYHPSDSGEGVIEWIRIA